MSILGLFESKMDQFWNTNRNWPNGPFVTTLMTYGKNDHLEFLSKIGNQSGFLPVVLSARLQIDHLKFQIAVRISKLIHFRFEKDTKWAFLTKFTKTASSEPKR